MSFDEEPEDIHGECRAEIERLSADLETERMRLAACGVAALANTAETVGQRIDQGSPYYSASYGDVCRAVDREMLLRKQVEILMAQPDGAPERLTVVSDEGLCRETAVREFLGWLSGHLPELRKVEVPRLAAAWEEYKGIVEAAARDGAYL